MKNYLLFLGHDYYPQGGWDDFAEDFNTLVEALAEVDKRVEEVKWYSDEVNWYHIIESSTGKMVKYGRFSYRKDGKGKRVLVDD